MNLFRPARMLSTVRLETCVVEEMTETVNSLDPIRTISQAASSLSALDMFSLSFELSLIAA